MSSRLDVYNSALLLCSERSITALTDVMESRYLLDSVWSSGGVDACLEEGQWYFAMRTQQIDYDPDLEPDFGYRRAFNKPTDWLFTSAFCSDEFFVNPCERYKDESGYWYSDLDTIYVRFVSNDDDYGMNMGQWPSSFHDFVAAHFASKIIGKLTGGDVGRIEAMLKLRTHLLRNAKNRAAAADSTLIAARGSWSTSRRRGSYRRDGSGNSGNLY